MMGFGLMHELLSITTRSISSTFNKRFTRINSALALLAQSVGASREKLPDAEFCLSANDWGSMGKFFVRSSAVFGGCLVDAGLRILFLARTWHWQLHRAQEKVFGGGESDAVAQED